MKFGTSGLRGLSADLIGRPSAVYAAAFGHYLLASGQVRSGDTILIGRDFRDSSPVIAEGCAAALASLGFNVVDCGTVPTPALALYGLRLGAASLMVTGSHIPADRNGIKFYRPDGEIDKSDELAISAKALELEATFEMPAGKLAIENRSADCATLFFSRNGALLPHLALNGMRIGVYQHSTVARDMLVDMLKDYGAEVLALGRSESFIPVDTEAVSAEAIGLFRNWTSAHQLDAIVSADGDGDRPLVTDEKGVPVRGDLLGLVAAMFLDCDVVVTPVTSNSGIDPSKGFTVKRTKVGSPFVIAGMNEAIASGCGKVVGFEANGGTLVGSQFRVNDTIVTPLPTRDCFLPILALLSLAASRRQAISSIVASFGLPAAAADRLENFPVETSKGLMSYLLQSPQNLMDFLAPIGAFDSSCEIDGLRVTLADRRIIHFRPSGNSPEMRCYVEAPDEATAATLLEDGLDRIRQWAREN